MCETFAGWNEQRLKREGRFADASVQHETTQTTQPFLSSSTTIQWETTQAVQSLEAASQEYRGFIAKHRDWPVAWTEQSGANCGMYAAAMAIRSLLTAKNGEVEQKIDDIAMALQAEVVEKGLSALGEMYDAEKLADAINRFLGTITSGTKAPRSAKERYHAQAITVDSEENFKTLLSECTKRGLRVLVPYLAYGSECKPGEFKVEAKENKKAKIIPLDGSGEPEDCGTGASDEGDETVKARGMDNAHWCMVYESDSDGNVKLVEGHGTLQNATVVDLFQSNASLVSVFDWRGYLILYHEMDASVETVGDVISFLEIKINSLNEEIAAIEEKEEKSEREAAVQDLSMIKIYLDKKQSTSTEAKLRHQVIVIGRNSESYNRTAAATATKTD